MQKEKMKIMYLRNRMLRMLHTGEGTNNALKGPGDPKGKPGSNRSNRIVISVLNRKIRENGRLSQSKGRRETNGTDASSRGKLSDV